MNTGNRQALQDQAAVNASLIDPDTTIGLVSLSVADLERSLAYYQERIGLTLLSREGAVATLGVDDAPLLRLHETPGARLVRRATGLYHFALRVPSRHDLALVLAHLATTRTPIGGASDHLVSEALYLSDPDGHGIEIYRDRPRSDWYDEQGQFVWGAADGQPRNMTLPLDIDSLLGELGGEQLSSSGLPSGSDMGHIHLQVADVAAAERFYVEVLGFARMMLIHSAAFVSAGGYHHHLGLNSWAGVGVAAPPEGAARLLSFEIRLPGEPALQQVLERVRAAGLPLERHADGWAVKDPSHNLVVLRS